MNRKIGDYIHLHWQNYYDHGTFRSSEKKNSNYSATLFDAHYQQIKNSIKQASIAPAERKKISSEYNARNEEAWVLFQDILKDKSHNYNALYELLHSINKLWTPEFIDEIITGLKWDESLNTLVYRPVSSNKNKQYKTSIVGWPALRLSAQGQFHEFETLLKYIEVAKKYLTSPSMSDSLSAREDVKRLQEMTNRIKKEKQVLSNWDKTERKLWHMTKNNTASVEQANFMHNILNKLLNNYVTQLNAMRLMYASAEEVNRQIQAAMAEIFGNIVATSASQLATDKIIDSIKDALSVGRTSSTPVTSQSNWLASLHIDTIEAELIQKPAYSKTVTWNGVSKDGHIKYGFTDLGQSRAQKRDVTLTIDAQDYGVSVKNTDITNAYLNYDAKKGNKHPSSISLQNSSLMLFLMGMEQDNPGIANHYLNALSSHPDTNGLAWAQSQALYNLKLYTLYSALTGQGQLRSATGAAQILAIYDKASNSSSRIRLYDMSEIIMAIEETAFTQGVKFSPAIDNSFLLKNEKVDINKSFQDAISTRITRNLLEARNKNISVSIYTAWLRDSIKSF